jgi:hypothetical protein
MSDIALRLAIQLAFCAAALRACKPDERDLIRFTGDYAGLPDMTIGQILDQADELLGSLPTAPTPSPPIKED